MAENIGISIMFIEICCQFTILENNYKNIRYINKLRVKDL